MAVLRAFAANEQDSAEVWQARSFRNLKSPARSSAMYSPIASFHGIGMRPNGGTGVRAFTASM